MARNNNNTASQTQTRQKHPDSGKQFHSRTHTHTYTPAVTQLSYCQVLNSLYDNARKEKEDGVATVRSA